jgi:hypothetical protein
MSEILCYFIVATKVRPPYSQGRVLPSSEGASALKRTAPRHAGIPALVAYATSVSQPPHPIERGRAFGQGPDRFAKPTYTPFKTERQKRPREAIFLQMKTTGSPSFRNMRLIQLIQARRLGHIYALLGVLCFFCIQAESLDDILIQITEQPKRQYTKLPAEYHDLWDICCIFKAKIKDMEEVIRMQTIANPVARKGELLEFQKYVKKEAQTEAQKVKEELIITAFQNSFPPEAIEAMQKKAEITDARLAELKKLAQSA